MLDLNDPRWKNFEGGYHTPYDASIPLKELEETTDMNRIQEILQEFWGELLHQGSVDIASYLAMPQLIRIAIKRELTHWDIPGLVGAIETQRHLNSPEIPEEFKKDYELEIKNIFEVINKNKNWDKTYAISALTAMAAVNKQPELAEVIIELEDDDLANKFASFLENYDEFNDWLKKEKNQQPKTNWLNFLKRK
jgi:hypothetical protein